MKPTATTDLSQAHWRKSSFSGGPNSNCVEIAPTHSGIAIRDSKNRHGPVLLVDTPAWHQLIQSVRNGQFEPA
jgi:hypothetical protein